MNWKAASAQHAGHHGKHDVVGCRSLVVGQVTMGAGTFAGTSSREEDRGAWRHHSRPPVPGSVGLPGASGHGAHGSTGRRPKDQKTPPAGPVLRRNLSAAERKQKEGLESPQALFVRSSGARAKRL